jgi:histidinol-phosphate aminotransferase
VSAVPSPLEGLPLPHIRELAAYTPGLQPSEPGWIKLNTNECPYPPSPRVAEALRGEIGADGAPLRLYPNPRSIPLRQAIARHHRVHEENVCVGNGSDDLLTLLARCFCSSATVAGYTVPSYSLYPVLIGIQDGRPLAIEFDRSMRLPAAKIAASAARIFFLTSPNAPTGVGFGAVEIESVLGAFDGILVVDEAYAPFARETAIPLLCKYPRLVVLRTFSKAYSLAGMRVGYALAHSEVIGYLDRVRDSYNVSRLAQTAALAALSDPSYYDGVIARVRATRDRCVQAFSRDRGWFTYASESNFIFTEPKNGRGESGAEVSRAAYEFLCARKILVRRFPSHALTAPFLRVSVGTDDEMLSLDQNLDAWLKGT